jgi:hypothetical protein
MNRLATSGVEIDGWVASAPRCWVECADDPGHGGDHCREDCSEEWQEALTLLFRATRSAQGTRDHRHRVEQLREQRSEDALQVCSTEAASRCSGIASSIRRCWTMPRITIAIFGTTLETKLSRMSPKKRCAS